MRLLGRGGVGGLFDDLEESSGLKQKIGVQCKKKKKNQVRFLLRTLSKIRTEGFVT